MCISWAYRVRNLQASKQQEIYPKIYCFSKKFVCNKKNETRNKQQQWQWILSYIGCCSGIRLVSPTPSPPSVQHQCFIIIVFIIHFFVGIVLLMYVFALVCWLLLLLVLLFGCVGFVRAAFWHSSGSFIVPHECLSTASWNVLWHNFVCLRVRKYQIWKREGQNERENVRYIFRLQEFAYLIGSLIRQPNVCKLTCPSHIFGEEGGVCGWCWAALAVPILHSYTMHNIGGEGWWLCGTRIRRQGIIENITARPTTDDDGCHSTPFVQIWLLIVTWIITHGFLLVELIRFFVCLFYRKYCQRRA